ncbi:MULTISPECIES: oxidoreductase [Paenibacillus]|uniref:NAD(P)H-binding protein n=3 Tax=Paenibacillus validus TaxID=44253 RepID=A0A7X2ZD64_9BACL|nr:MULTISPECIES: oxidoreductase [Paenibacillus]MUG72155.1 NAD(P)H-binding protein [Paenibacillus validus]
MSKIAVVAGATGLVGGELVRLLLEHAGYDHVVTLGRRQTGLQHPRLTERTVLFDRLEEGTDQLLQGADVFCALGTTIRKAGSEAAFRQVDYEYPLALGRAALRDGAARFLMVSSIGANRESSFFYLRVKGDIEQALAELKLPELAIFRPSQLLGERKEARPAERLAGVLVKPLGKLLIGRLAKYRAIEARTVALAMVRAAQRGTPGVRIYESNEIAALAAGT